MYSAVRYREYAPCEALRGWVRSLFSFSEASSEPSRRPALLNVEFHPGERICAPTLADAHASIVFSFDKYYCPDGTWHALQSSPRADVIGPMAFPGPPSVPARPESIGAYLCAGAVLSGPPAVELANRFVALEHLWRAERYLAEELNSLQNETARLDRLESVLVQWRQAGRSGWTRFDISGMARSIVACGGRLPIERLSEMADLSRRHLTRVFRENIGVSPKTYSELARFRSALSYVRRGGTIGWAQVAVQCGYADQSHMIAEFRRFSGFTPEALARGKWFHPFFEI